MKATRLVSIALLAVALISVSAPAAAVQLPAGKSDLYYRLGGSDPASRAPNPAATSMKIGLGGALRLNYSCGQFDIGLSWQTLMNGFASVGTTVTSAVQAGVAALPLYILQRAQPGLYELFQTYAKKAEAAIDFATKSCQQMEREVMDGQNPYEDWVRMARGQAWKNEAASNSDIVSTHEKVGMRDGTDGVDWIGGRRGGVGQEPINLIKDSIKGAYNVTMMKPPATVTGIYPDNKLKKTFVSPETAAIFATEVLGDVVIGLCALPGCPQRATKTGLGLLPRYEAEIAGAETQLNTTLATPTPSATDLDAASAPGVLVSRELINAIQAMSPVEKPIVAGRIAKDVALARTVDKALTVRNLLVTARTIPELYASAGRKRIDDAIVELNRHIDDLMYEVRVRRELVSEPAQMVLREHMRTRGESTARGAADALDTERFRGGRIK